MAQRPVSPRANPAGFGSGISRGFSAIYQALLLVRNIKIVLPLLLYFLFELAVITIYARSGPGALDGFWALFLPGRGAGAIARYPQRLLLLPELIGYLDIALDILLHVIAQGITVLLIASALGGKPLDLTRSFSRAMRRYLHLVGVMIVATLIILMATYLPVLPSLLGWTARNRHFEIGGYIVLGILSQAFFLYAIPFVILNGEPIFGAIGKSFRFAFRRYLLSLTLAAVPFILILPTFLLGLKAQIISLRIFPELIVFIQILGEIMKLVSSYVLVGGVTVIHVEENPVLSGPDRREPET